MKEYACTEECFLKDVATHAMTVLRDDGVHRHIRFRRPDTNAYWFDLITWPGTLCIDGDMGTWVFRRLEDMFEFFRTDRQYMRRDGRQLAINPGYWAEKLQATSVYGKGPMEFSAESFAEHVREAFNSWVEDNKPDDDATQAERDDFDECKTALLDEIQTEVLWSADDGEIRAIDAAMNFDSEHAADFEFSDAWEWNCKAFTFHFIWCCYAIAWGIKTYDEATAVKESAA